jgi:hypothetical protein
MLKSFYLNKNIHKTWKLFIRNDEFGCMFNFTNIKTYNGFSEYADFQVFFYDAYKVWKVEQNMDYKNDFKTIFSNVPVNKTHGSLETNHTTCQWQLDWTSKEKKQDGILYKCKLTDLNFESLKVTGSLQSNENFFYWNKAPATLIRRECYHTPLLSTTVIANHFFNIQGQKTSLKLHAIHSSLQMNWIPAQLPIARIHLEYEGKVFDIVGVSNLYTIKSKQDHFSWKIKAKSKDFTFHIHTQYETKTLHTKRLGDTSGSYFYSYFTPYATTYVKVFYQSKLHHIYLCNKQSVIDFYTKGKNPYIMDEVLLSKERLS